MRSGACFRKGRTHSGPGDGAAGPDSALSILQEEARPATWAQETGSRGQDLPHQVWCVCLPLGLLFAVPSGQGGGGGRLGMGGAYRGGAGRENVITRSSLLKVRHRLGGTEFVGGGVTLGQGQTEARRLPPSLPQGDARSHQPQGQEARDKCNKDPLLPIPTTQGQGEWRPRPSGWTQLGNPSAGTRGDSLLLLSEPLPLGRSQTAPPMAQGPSPPPCTPVSFRGPC